MRTSIRPANGCRNCWVRSTSRKCYAIGTSPVRQNWTPWSCWIGFCARADESELQHRTSLDAQVSSASSQATTDSCASVMTTPAVVDVTSPSRLNRLDESLLSDQSNDSSDEDDFETVASPPSAYCIAAARSPAPSAPTNESSSTTATTERAQACSDPASATSLGNITSPSMTSQINPFKQLVLKDKHYSPEGVDGGTSPDIASYEMSPSIGASSLISSPVDIRSLLAHESNRLETFRKQHRSTFARIDVAHLAYVGFFLHVGGAHVECPWCEVELTEERLMHIMDTQPSVARSTLSDEPWTPMRVHRHANGLRMGQTHSWCTWVRREAGGLYPNIAMVSDGRSRLNSAIPSVRGLAGKSTAVSRISVVFEHRKAYEIVHIRVEVPERQSTVQSNDGRSRFHLHGWRQCLLLLLRE